MSNENLMLDENDAFMKVFNKFPKIDLINKTFTNIGLATMSTKQFFIFSQFSNLPKGTVFTFESNSVIKPLFYEEKQPVSKRLTIVFISNDGSKIVSITKMFYDVKKPKFYHYDFIVTEENRKNNVRFYLNKELVNFEHFFSIVLNEDLSINNYLYTEINNLREKARLYHKAQRKELNL